MPNHHEWSHTGHVDLPVRPGGRRHTSALLDQPRARERQDDCASSGSQFDDVTACTARRTPRTRAREGTAGAPAAPAAEPRSAYRDHPPDGNVGTMAKLIGFEER